MTHTGPRKGLCSGAAARFQDPRVEDTLQASAPYEGGKSRARFAFKPLQAIAENNLSRQIAR